MAGAPGAGALRVELGPRGSGRLAWVGLDDYVRDVIVAEIAVAPADGALAERIYQAQAIVARTYAVAVRGRHRADGFDVCSTTHCQVYQQDAWRRSRWATAIERAVRTTSGVVVTEQGRPIEAVFHAHCGGHTSAAIDVWRGVPTRYLRAVPDPFCLRESPAAWSWRLALTQLRDALNTGPRTAVGARLDAVQVVRRDAGDRVADVLLSGERGPVVSGEDFRLAVLAAHGAATLRSTRFTVRRDGQALVFDGTGSGHGVGLCQTGLVGRVRAGQTPAEVLQAYYPGTRLERLGGT
jgi:stage II sporulation protein D